MTSSVVDIYIHIFKTGGRWFSVGKPFVTLASMLCVFESMDRVGKIVTGVWCAKMLDDSNSKEKTRYPRSKSEHVLASKRCTVLCCGWVPFSQTVWREAFGLDNNVCLYMANINFVFEIDFVVGCIKERNIYRSINACSFARFPSNTSAWDGERESVCVRVRAQGGIGTKCTALYLYEDGDKRCWNFPQSTYTWEVWMR